ncbi:glycosyltransferase [Thioclava electrotropha]|uniref:glycosyltransferase n=2 Tax=Thioclava TaxID=285107 RepID=UPI0023A793CA|nr:glycosyltransferase [Thioclava electrotropha]
MSVKPPCPETRPGPALAVLIEPAPYMVAMTAALAARWPTDLTVRYVSAAVTQNWADAPPETVLPARRLSALVSLWREIRSTRPKVIFVAGWAHVPVLAAIVLGKLSGARIIALSDTWISPARGIRAILKRRILAMIDGFCPAGQRAADYLRDQGVPPEKIVPGRMSSDTTAIARHIRTLGPEGRQEMRARLGIAADAPVLMFLGRLAREKGLDLLLPAFKAVDDPQLVLVLAGPATPEYRSELEHTARQLVRLAPRGHGDARELLGLQSFGLL